MKTHKLNFLKGDPVPVPYYVGGEVNMHLLRFLTRRFYHPSAFNSEKKKKATKEISGKTLSDMAYNISYMINTIAKDIDVTDENDEVAVAGSINYLNIEYFQLKKVIQAMHDEWEIKGQSLKSYVRHFREYMDFLDSECIPHNLVFEGKIKTKRAANKDDDFLSYTEASVDYYEGEKEPLIKDEWMEYSDDYKGKVISMKQFSQLYEALKKKDIVYAVMAATMLQTFLRIGGIMQFPFGATAKNPRWKRYTNLDKDQMSQPLNYTKKGGEKGTCLVHRETMKFVHEEYIEPHRGARQTLYETKYVPSKHAKNTGRTADDTFMWLNKHGTPVSIQELQSAFSEVSEELGFDVTAHFMRHTGATQLLYRWGEAENTTICSAHKDAIHTFLKQQLGHVLMETTLYYIRTVENLVNEKVYVEFMPDVLIPKKGDSPVTRSAYKAYNDAMKEHKKFMKAS